MELLEAVNHLTEWITRRSREHGLIVLLRHSVRVPITGFGLSEALQAPLTDEGRELARELGRRFPGDRSLRIFFSPVPRCEDTASCIAAGATEQGVQVTTAGSRSYLGASFVRDSEQVVSGFKSRGLKGFLRAWCDGVYDEAVIDPPARASGDLLRKLVSERGEGDEQTIDLHVTHDLTLVVLLAQMLDVTAADFGWPRFLEGVLLSLRPDGIIWRYRDRESTVILER